MDEAEIVTTEQGDVPRGEGWYVLSAQRARWQHSPGFGGSDLSFQGDVRFPEVGFHLGVLLPGEPACMYHREDTQEGFLVLSGRCLAIVEGQERLLEAWDYLHCPGGTEHVLVGAGDGPCVVIAYGARRPDDGTLYVADAVAARHGASVAADTPDPAIAYADAPAFTDGQAPPLPGLTSTAAG
jgi:uncharacterized cupin superfamily protein